jgi:hypothetical protein
MLDMNRLSKVELLLALDFIVRQVETDLQELLHVEVRFCPSLIFRNRQKSKRASCRVVWHFPNWIPSQNNISFRTYFGLISFYFTLLFLLSYNFPSLSLIALPAGAYFGYLMGRCCEEAFFQAPSC